MKMLKANGFLFFLLAAVPIHVFSQENVAAENAERNTEIESAEKITVERAVEQALKTHVDIQRGEIVLKQAKRENSSSWNQVLPSVSASVSGSNKQTWKDSETNTVSVSGGINANLSLDLGLADRIKKIKSEYEAQKTSFAAAVRSTESAVRQSFYNLLYLKEKWNSAKSTLDSYKRTYEQTQRKYSKGVATQIDLLAAQVNYESSKPDVDSAASSYTNALMKFIDTVGFDFPAGTQFELEGSLDTADSVKEIDHSDIESNIQNAPEIVQLEQNLAAAKHNKKATEFSLLLPSLSLGASYTPELWAKETKSGTETDVPYWNISAGISLPLDSWIPGSSAKNKIAALDDSVKDYEIQLSDKRKTVRTSAIEKLKNIELSKKTLEARRLNLKLAQQSYEMTEEAYSRGTKDLLTLQNSLDTLEKAQLQLKSEQLALISNVLDLENLLGLELGTYF